MCLNKNVPSSRANKFCSDKSRLDLWAVIRLAVKLTFPHQNYQKELVLRIEVLVGR